VVWRLAHRRPVRDWAVQKQPQQSDLLALLSEDGRTIEIIGVLMTAYVPPEPESGLFEPFKYPSLLLAVLLALSLYQYATSSSSPEPSSSSSGTSKGGQKQGGMKGVPKKFEPKVPKL
ncbi:unnamed protein product, partial [Polarella glacialis]